MIILTLKCQNIVLHLIPVSTALMSWMELSPGKNINLLPPGTAIKQEDQSPGGKESDLSTKANIIGMEEGSEK